MPSEVRIEHSYPEALAFLRHHGPEALAVVHDLLAQAQDRQGQLVVQTSVRQVAERLGLVSKDTVNRRMRALLAAGVIAARSPAPPAPSRPPPTSWTSAAPASPSPPRPSPAPPERRSPAHPHGPHPVAAQNRRVHTHQRDAPVTVRVTTLK
ncbi:MAG TPA: winged helix-turn-helix domain-containing protein, partial [Acidimicrobiales bacterium]|nr:winged helix-turn-helix domain-containing protein [Acidimicrobiales bacterium]